MIYDRVPAKDAERLDGNKYNPCCGTPLYDAIGKTCMQLKEHIKDNPAANVVVTIITDGNENSSKEWTGLSVKKDIEDLKVSDEELREQKKKISRNYFNKEVK